MNDLWPHVICRRCGKTWWFPLAGHREAELCLDCWQKFSEMEAYVESLEAVEDYVDGLSDDC
jgi:DNA-directed RNA polymerase subunit RPC12/RpoP